MICPFTEDDPGPDPQDDDFEMFAGTKYDSEKVSPLADGFPIVSAEEAALELAGMNVWDMDVKVSLIKFHTIDTPTLLEVMDIISYGAVKYAPENWKKVDRARERYSDAFWRHYHHQVYYPEDLDARDKESGKFHISHAICNLLFLTYTFPSDLSDAERELLVEETLNEMYREAGP